MTVGFQGVPGAFSEEAIFVLLGEGVDARGYQSFYELLAAVSSRSIDRALLPLENTIAGSVSAAVAALAAFSDLVVEIEVEHQVDQCLIGLPGARRETIASATSHPVALAQCARFFAAHPEIEARAGFDTAGAVREIMAQGDPSQAAIASSRCAELYGGIVLARGIQDDARNRTRFVLLAAAP